ncbi:hypothetical protein BY996DRAFT_8524976, partial [Phakopsora pachyrhizi]
LEKFRIREFIKGENQKGFIEKRRYSRRYLTVKLKMNLNQQTVAAEASSSSSPSIIRFLSSPISYHNHSNRQDDLQLQLRTPQSDLTHPQTNCHDISADQMMEIEQPVFNSTMNFAGIVITGIDPSNNRASPVADHLDITATVEVYLEGAVDHHLWQALISTRMIDGRGSHSRLPRGSDAVKENELEPETDRDMGDTNSLNSRGVKSKGNDKTYWEGQDRPFEEEELRILEALDRREMARLRRELRERLEENVMMTELEFDKILEEEYRLDLDEIEEEEDPYEIYQSLCLNDQEQWQDQGQRRGVEGDDEYDYPVGDDDLEMMAIET